MNDQKTCRHNCKTYDVAEPKNCYKNLQCAKQDGCKIPLSGSLTYILIDFTWVHFGLITLWVSYSITLTYKGSGYKPGRLFDCQFYHADAWVCMSQEQSKRKYDWIEYEDGRILGKKDQCESIHTDTRLYIISRSDLKRLTIDDLFLS